MKRIGQHLGSYRLVHLLGSGTFADVYLGEHLYLHTPTAIKILHTNLDAHLIENFLTEARHVSHLTHPHIIRVFDLGLEDWIPYLVMDYASQGNLREKHPSGATVSLSTVFSYIRAIASALSKEPAHRFVDVLSFAEVLEEASSVAPSQPMPPPQPSPIPTPEAPVRSFPQISQARFQGVPEPLTPQIGREEIQQRVRALLEHPQIRMLTLTGAPGVGKTRLAQALSRDLAGKFTHGACFIPLAHINRPDLVAPSIADALDLRWSREHALLEQLKTFLRDKQLLLLLDNFEQVLSASPLLTELLAACPQLKILVTSRSILHLEGEHVFTVLPLALPDLHHLPGLETLGHAAAVELFVERAKEIQPEFELTEENAPTIAKICVWLDGLPLAISLAAARSNLLSPDVLLSLLEKHRLVMLTRGKRDAPARQQTMHSAISWSYDLLTVEEQTLFRRLAAFAGECTLEAAEAVCTALGSLSIPTLDGMGSLLDNSLLIEREHKRQEPRFIMLETLREYGLGLLAASGELEACRDAHAAYFLTLAERAESALHGPEQGRWRERLERERGNIWIALQWLLEHEKIEDAFRLAIALQLFWLLQGRLSEGRSFMEQVLEVESRCAIPVSPLTRAKMLYAVWWLAFWQNDHHQTLPLLEESLGLFRSSQDKAGIALTLAYRGLILHNRGDEEAGMGMFGEALKLSRAGGEKSNLAEVLEVIGAIALFRGEFRRAYELIEEALVLFTEVGDVWRIGTTLHLLSWTAYSQGEYISASQLAEQSLALFRTVGKPALFGEALIALAYTRLALGEENAAGALLKEALTLSREQEHSEESAWALCGLGHLALHRGDPTRARSFYEESISLLKGRWINPRIKWVLASCLEGLGNIALARGQAAWAVLLFAAADAVRGAYGYYSPLGIEQPSYDHALAKARKKLGAQGFAAAWTAGQAMTPEQSLRAEEREVAYRADGMTVAAVASLLPLHSPLPAHARELTPREAEVLNLLTTGLSNSRIAEVLVLSPHTVGVHVQSIYRKLGVNSRSAATRFALEHHLA
jgi:predicted ATPase/DNA-binding CsgD family transcriptional regulator